MSTAKTVGLTRLIFGDEELREPVKEKPVLGFVGNNCFVGERIKIRGLKNLGSTCYMNAVVQNLLVIADLREYFTGLGQSWIGSMTSALKQLFQSTAVGDVDTDALDPTFLLLCVRYRNPCFNDNLQQDSHELLLCLREGLKDEEVKARKTLKSGEHEFDDDESVPPTMVESVFGGLLSYNITCLKCGSTNKTDVPFLDLSLPIPTKVRKRENDRVGDPVVAESTGEDLGVSSSDQSSINESGSAGGAALGRVLSVLNSLVSSLDASELQSQFEKSYGGEKSLFLALYAKPDCPDNDGMDPDELAKIESDLIGGEVKLKISRTDLAKATEYLGSLTGEQEKNKKPMEDTPVKTNTSTEGNLSQEEVEEETSLYSCLEMYTRAEPLSRAHCDNCLKATLAQNTEHRTDGEATLQMNANSQPNIYGVIANYDGVLDNKIIEENTDGGIKVSQSRLGEVEDPGFATSCELDQHAEAEKDSDSINLAQPADNCYESPILDTSNLPKGNENVTFGLDKDLEDPQVDVEVQNDATTQTLLIEKAPSVLVLHLMRFFHVKGSPNSRKINGHISFSEFLDLEPYFNKSSKEKKTPFYRLTGVIEHKGTTLEEGHYIAHVRGEQVKATEPAIFNWFRISDTQVLESSLSDVLQSEAYILFYEKCLR